MKRKTKELLGKRVISGALSAAMTFNMSAIFPMNAFADENVNVNNTDNVLHFQGNTYRRFDDPMSWKAAKEYCEQLGGHLATITTAEEQNIIAQLISKGNKSSYWLGATDESVDGEWLWITGEEFTYSNWGHGQPDNSYSGTEDYLGISRLNQGWANTNEWNDFVENSLSYDGGFICEWEKESVEPSKQEALSPYVLFSGSETEDFTLNCWKSTFNGDVYTGRSFVTNASEVYLNGRVNAAENITTNGWIIDIDERNEHSKKEIMPDLDAAIHNRAGEYEFVDEDIVRIEDKNIIEGSLKTAGSVTISGTTFDGVCYIIADGDITYNINEFKSAGKIVLYSRKGNITINGTNIDVSGILYAPKGTVSFNSNITNIKGRVFADNIKFSGSIFNAEGSESDWELIGNKNVVSKTYTTDADFNEGVLDGLGLDVADELTLGQRIEGIGDYSEKRFIGDDSANGIELSVNADKSVLEVPSDEVTLKFDLAGYGDQEIKENNVDLAIVVDTSGSMSGARRNNAVAAAKEVVSKMKENDRCAVIKFTDGAYALQDFTNDAALLETAINKLNASGGTNIASGIRKAVELFSKSENDSSQKYIILLSDGEDSSRSAQEAEAAYALGIRIFALSIGSNSNQMHNIADNSNGIYLNSPTAEQINEMMQQFADEVFNNAGKDVAFSVTIPRGAKVSDKSAAPDPLKISENEDGSKTLIWSYDNITIDGAETIELPLKFTDAHNGLIQAAKDITCTYYNRKGEMSSIKADDIVLPAHNYNQSGSWTTIYDSNHEGTSWDRIRWNGKLYDDGVISVKAQAGDDPNDLGEWIDITNHEQIHGLSGRYIKVKVEMKVSSSGKTPELFDITIDSNSNDDVSYVNSAPEAVIVGSDTAFVGEKYSLIAKCEDDAFCSKLSYNWDCDSDKTIVGESDSPYAFFTFDEIGEYNISLTVSDGNSNTVIGKTVTVYRKEDSETPVIDIDVPLTVKGGTEVTGKAVITNGVKADRFELTAGDEGCLVSSDGDFSFTTPNEDTIIPIKAKAYNPFGAYGENECYVLVDGTAPNAELKTENASVTVGETVNVVAVVNDENGIKDYSITIDGKTVEFDENDHYSFIPDKAGEYVFELKAVDTVGNTAIANLKINVKALPEQPDVMYSVPKMLITGEEGRFAFDVDDKTDLTVKLNGKEIILSNNAFVYTPQETGDITLDILAENGSEINTEIKLTIPVVSIKLESDRTAYSDNDLIKVQLVHSDNLHIMEQTASIDTTEYTIEDNVITAENLSAGSHIVTWHVKDECGKIMSVDLVIDVSDLTVPEITVNLSKEELTEGDDVTAFFEASDRYGIKSVQAKLDNKTIVLTEGKAELEDLSSGEHTITVTAVDNNNNTADYNYIFVVSHKDNTPPELNITAYVDKKNTIIVDATADDDSGTAVISGTINGKKLDFADGTAYYDSDAPGRFEIIVRAEDAEGNYTEKTQIVTISELIKDYELKISAIPDKNNVKPNEPVSILVSTNSFFDDVTLDCVSDGGRITKNNNEFIFESSECGTFTLVFSAKDEKDNKCEERIIIIVSENTQEGDNGEVEGDEKEYENKYTPTSRARVILESDEKTETKMTEEMADLVDHLKTPLNVFEYLYNNVNVEYYKGSRKGSIGTYEQSGGNDVDSASLLIAMLRYLGYEADYVTGNIGVTEQQFMELTGTSTISDAKKIWGIHGGLLTIGSDKISFEHTWVRTVIDGETYDLDISFKKYEKVASLRNLIENNEELYDSYKVNSSMDLHKALKGLKNQDISNIEDVGVSGIDICKKAFSKLPSETVYSIINIKEIIADIQSSEIISSDQVTFTIGNNSVVCYSAALNIHDITIGYVPDPSKKELFELLDLDFPNSVYELYDAIYMIGVRLDAVPVLYVDNKIQHIWNVKSKVGQTNDLHIKISSSGAINEYDKTLDVGSVNAFVFDLQSISGQQLQTSYDKIPSNDKISGDGAANIRNSDLLKDYLTLMGRVYFSQLDMQNTLLSSAFDLHKERYLSFGVFTYCPVSTDLEYGSTFEDKGTIEVDILGNDYSQRSYSSNHDDEESYHMISGYISSYLESAVIEQFTGEEAISTAKVLEEAQLRGVDIKLVTSYNVNVLDSCNLYPEDKEVIRNSVAEGKVVLVPERNITVNKWTGTGYIIQDLENWDLDFKITGSLNGGIISITANSKALATFVTICNGVAFVNLIESIFQAAQSISNTIALFFETSCLGPIGWQIAAVSVGYEMYKLAKAFQEYQENVQTCIKALQRDPDAVIDLYNDTQSEIINTIISSLMDIAASAVQSYLNELSLMKRFGEEISEHLASIYGDDIGLARDFVVKSEQYGLTDKTTLVLVERPDLVCEYPDNWLKIVSDLDENIQDTSVNSIIVGGKPIISAFEEIDKDTVYDFTTISSFLPEEFYQNNSNNYNWADTIEYTVDFQNDGINIIINSGNQGNTNIKRPTWRQSEIDVEKDHPDYDAQVSFKNGKKVNYHTKGSVRPDLYKDGFSIDVKNYNITNQNGRSRLIANIEKQYHQRQIHLPSGTKQAVIIDVRGQNIPTSVLNQLEQDIKRHTGPDMSVTFKK